MHWTMNASCYIPRARSFKLLRSPGIDSTESIPCEKSFPMWNWFLKSSIQCEGIEYISRVVVVICGGQHFLTRQKYDSCRQGKKSRFLIKKLTFYGKWPTRFHTRHIPNSSNQFFPHNPSKNSCSEPVFVNLLRSPEIDSQPGRPVRQPYLSYRPSRLHRLAK